MSPRLQNRVAIITGASSGLGRAIALAYAHEGASVVCADLQPTARADTQNEFPVATHDLIIQQGGKALFFKADVREEEQIRALVAKAVEEFGRLDIMVNNAGIALEVDQLVEKPGGMRAHEIPTSNFDLTMSINARGVFLGCKHAISQFLAQDPLPVNSRGDITRGWIVNIASIAGVVGLAASPSYVTSKHAVIGLTKAIALDYAKDRVHCNAICPGFIDTAMIAAITRDAENPIAVGATAAIKAGHPWGTLGKPEDIARAALFLVSEDAQWVTGHPLVVDGGYIAQ